MQVHWTCKANTITIIPKSNYKTISVCIWFIWNCTIALSLQRKYRHKNFISSKFHHKSNHEEPFYLALVSSVCSSVSASRWKIGLQQFSDIRYIQIQKQTNWQVKMETHIEIKTTENFKITYLPFIDAIQFSEIVNPLYILVKLRSERADKLELDFVKSLKSWKEISFKGITRVNCCHLLRGKYKIGNQKYKKERNPFLKN